MTQPTDEFNKPDPSQAQDDRPTPFDSPSLRLVPRLEGVEVTLCRVQHRILFEHDDPDYSFTRRAKACARHHRLNLATADGVNPIRTGEPWPSRVNRLPALAMSG